MNEIVIIYHYSSEYRGERIEFLKSHAAHERVTLKLNSITLLDGDCYGEVDGFLLACKKLLTFHSVSHQYVID